MDLFGVLNQGWFGIIAGAAIGVFFYQRAKRDPRISYQVSTRTLIAGVPQSLQERVSISIDGQQTSDLLSTRLVLWNSGTAAVKSDSFPVGGGLLIRPEIMSDVVGFDVLTATNSINGIKLMATGTGIAVELDYLNPGDGAIVDILHRSEAGKIRLDGTLLGQQRGIFYEGKIGIERSTQRSFRTPTKDLLEGIGFLAAGSLCLFIGTEYWDAYSGGVVVSKTLSVSEHLYGAIGMSVFGLIAIVVGIFSIAMSRRHPPERIALPED